MTYYNTTQERGQTLTCNWVKTAKQDELVLLIFATNKEALFTPFEVQTILRDDYEKSFPITSIRFSESSLIFSSIFGKPEDAFSEISANN